jgi:hypothetical protein
MYALRTYVTADIYLKIQEYKVVNDLFFKNHNHHHNAPVYISKSIL